MKYVAVVSFDKEKEAHSLNVLYPDVADDHMRNLLKNGFTVHKKSFEYYSDALKWANAVYYKTEEPDAAV